MANDAPDWDLGYVPLPAEWNYWFGKKADGGSFLPLVDGYVSVPISFPPTFTWTGDSLAANPFITQNATFTGHNTGTLQSAVNWFNITDNMDSGSAAGNGFSVLHPYLNVGGSGKKGQANAVDISLLFYATSGNTSISSPYGGLRSTVISQANDNGDAGTQRGGLYAFNGVAQLLPGATYWDGLTACEFDIGVNSGASVQDKIGVSIVTLNGDAVSGIRDDIFLTLCSQYSQTTGIGMTYGLAFGRLGSPGTGMKQTGTLITVLGPPQTFNKGIALRRDTYTTSSIDVKGFTVRGDGVSVLDGDIILGAAVSPGADSHIYTATGSNIVLAPQGSAIVFTASDLNVVGNAIAHTYVSTTNQAINFSGQTNGSGSSTGTLTNAPNSGNPSFWLPVFINGVARKIPCWS